MYSYTKEQAAEWQRNNYKKNKDKIKAQRRANWHKLKDRVFDILGRKCVRCGFSDERALQIDHIGGGGNTERVKRGGMYAMLKRIISVDGEGYQILCANCNWIKRWENDEVAEGAKGYYSARNNSN
jgi:hypothetical protein